MMWWLIIHTPDGVYTWPAWGEKDPPDEDLINRARVAVGFPAHERWPLDGSGYDVQLTLGEPHESLLLRATVGTTDDLRAVDAGDVAVHVTQRLANSRVAQVEAAKTALLEMDPEVLAEALTAVADTIREAANGLSR